MGDFRFAVRMLRKSPAFLITAVLSLALGIGATTTVFSAFRAVFLRPLPYAAPERLVEITKPRAEGGSVSVTVADAGFWREFSRSFESLGTYGFYRPLTMTGGSEPVNGIARMVQKDLFPTLGSKPAVGRVFVAGDFEEGNPRAVLLSYRIWREEFGGDPGIVGRRVMLDNDSYNVIGVMPYEFQFPSSFFNMWIPDREKASDPENRVNVIARLKKGVTLQAAQAEMNRMLPALVQSYPEARRHIRVELAPLDQRDSKTWSAFVMLCGAVGLLVLIACLNVANLVIARSAAREVEFAVRSALGASRQRLVRQVLAESFVVAAAGGAIGLALAWAGNRALLAALPAHYRIGRLDETRLDLMVLAFALAVTMGTAVLFGLGPAVVLSRCRLRASRFQWRGGLVVAEVALSLALLIGAGLLIRSFVTLAAVDPGFRPDHVLSAMVPAGTQFSRDKPTLVRRLTMILERSGQLPGVTAAGLATAIPFGQINVSITFALPDHPGEEIGINYRAVSADYFRTMGVPLRLGRMFTERDDAAGPKVAMVNEACARKYFPGKNPIGQLLAGARHVTIVGVIADMHRRTPAAAPEPELYEPYTQYLGPAPGATILMRTHGDPAGLAAAFRKAVHTLYPDQPVADVAT
ncbi:MAG: ADOP family duplicated permease, partial [Acidobacteriota bacterium]